MRRRMKLSSRCDGRAEPSRQLIGGVDREEFAVDEETLRSDRSGKRWSRSPKQRNLILFVRVKRTTLCSCWPSLTYGCPLHCPYCSNPVNFIVGWTGNWKLPSGRRVFKPKRRSWACSNVGLVGRRTVAEAATIFPNWSAAAREAGVYTAILSPARVGLDLERVPGNCSASGLDSIQISFPVG